MTPILTLVMLAANAQPAPGIAPPARDEARIRPPLVRATYAVKVQADSILPKGERPEATVPAGERLAVSIQPERKSFPANGPLGLTVTLTNKSDKPLRLYGAEKLGKRPELVLVHQKTGAQVRMTGNWDADLTQPAMTLEPGKSYERTFAVVLEGGVVPGPIPMPRPIPLPGPKPGLPIERGALDEKREAAPEPAGKFAAPGLIAAPLPALLAPEGTIRLRLMLEFVAPAVAGKEDPAAFSGRLASAPIDVEFTPAVWKPAPVPPGGGPVTKEQAITIAQQAAEGALTAAYNPLDPVRPPKEGAWIGDPKAATVKDRANNAGWTVSWTHTAKGKGHSYHVVIDVGTNGQPNVREVFAGYSNR